MEPRFNIIMILFLMILASCECVPTIDTEKIVEPVESANILFVHALPDFGELRIQADGKSNLKTIDYDQRVFNYVKIGSGRNNFKVYYPALNRTMYNCLVDLTKDKKYTIILYGFKSRINVLMLEDTISDYSSGKAYWRCVDVSGISSKVDFILSKDTTKHIFASVDNSGNTGFAALPEDTYKLEIKQNSNESLVFTKNDILLKNGIAYTLVLRGYSEPNEERRLSCLIVAAGE